MMEEKQKMVLVMAYSRLVMNQNVITVAKDQIISKDPITGNRLQEILGDLEKARESLNEILQPVTKKK